MAKAEISLKKTLKQLENIDVNPNEAVIRQANRIKKAGRLIKPDSKLDKIDARTQLFLTRWLETGKAQTAYAETFKEENPEKAMRNGTALISAWRPYINQSIREKYGATEAIYYQKVIELMNAKKTVFTKRYGIQKVDDLPTQTQATKMLGTSIISTIAENAPKQVIGNFVIVKDKDKGIFEIGDSEEGQVVE